MKIEEIDSKLSYLEKQSSKFGILTTLTEKQISKLKTILDSYKIDINKPIKEIKIPKNLSNIEKILKDRNMDLKNISSGNTVKVIVDIINKELKNLSELENKLNNIINIKNILVYDVMKSKILEDKALTREDELSIITTTNNKLKIKKIKDYINKINFINKNSIENYILKEENKIILDIDNEIDTICFQLNIDTKNKSYKEKYYQILEKLNGLTSSLKILLIDLDKIYNGIICYENGLTNTMNKEGVEINLTFDEIKELTEIDIDNLINEIKTYESSKKQITNETKKIF